MSSETAPAAPIPKDGRWGKKETTWRLTRCESKTPPKTCGSVQAFGWGWVCGGVCLHGHRSISPGHSFQEGSRIYNNKGFVKVNQVGLHCGTLHHTGPHTGNHFPCGNRLSAHGWHHSSMCIAPWKGTPPNLHVPTTIMSMFHAYHRHHSTSHCIHIGDWLHHHRSHLWAHFHITQVISEYLHPISLGVGCLTACGSQVLLCLHSKEHTCSVYKHHGNKIRDAHCDTLAFDSHCLWRSWHLARKSFLQSARPSAPVQLHTRSSTLVCKAAAVSQLLWSWAARGSVSACSIAAARGAPSTSREQHPLLQPRWRGLSLFRELQTEAEAGIHHQGRPAL